MKEFEVKFTVAEKTVIHKIVQSKKMPKMLMELAEETINSELIIKRLK